MQTLLNNYNPTQQNFYWENPFTTWRIQSKGWEQNENLSNVSSLLRLVSN
jgi:hypothetical protein